MGEPIQMLCFEVNCQTHQWLKPYVITRTFISGHMLLLKDITSFYCSLLYKPLAYRLLLILFQERLDGPYQSCVARPSSAQAIIACSIRARSQRAGAYTESDTALHEQSLAMRDQALTLLYFFLEVFHYVHKEMLCLAFRTLSLESVINL